MDPKFESFQTHLGPKKTKKQCTSGALEGNNNTLLYTLDKVEGPLFAITDSLCHALHGSQNDGGSTKELFHNLTLQSH